MYFAKISVLSFIAAIHFFPCSCRRSSEPSGRKAQHDTSLSVSKSSTPPKPKTVTPSLSKACEAASRGNWRQVLSTVAPKPADPLTLLCQMVAAQVVSEYDRTAVLGDELLSRSHAAMVAIDAWIEKRPNNPHLALIKAMGIILLSLDDLRQSGKAAASRSVSLLPHNPWALNVLSMFNIQDKKWRLAEEQARRALQYNDFPEPYNNLAVIYNATGERKKLQTALLTAMKRFPAMNNSFTNYVNSLGEERVAMDSDVIASERCLSAEDYERALGSVNDSGIGRLNLGRALVAAGCVQQGYAVCLTLTSMPGLSRSKRGALLVDAALVFQEADRNDRTVDLLGRAQSFGANDYKTFFHLGTAHAHLENAEQAKKFYRKSLALNRDDSAEAKRFRASAYGDLGALELLADNNQAAVDLLKRAMQINEQDMLNAGNLAWALHWTGRDCEAEQLARKVAKNAAETPPGQSAVELLSRLHCKQ